jgi:hypothetical protein
LAGGCTGADSSESVLFGSAEAAARSEVPPLEATEETHTSGSADSTVSKTPLTEEELRSSVSWRNSSPPDSVPDSLWIGYDIPDYVLTPEVMISSPCSPSVESLSQCDDLPPNDFSLTPSKSKWDDLLTQSQTDSGQGDLDVVLNGGLASWSVSTSGLTQYNISQSVESVSNAIPQSVESASNAILQPAESISNAIPWNNESVSNETSQTAKSQAVGTEEDGSSWIHDPSWDIFDENELLMKTNY